MASKIQLGYPCQKIIDWLINHQPSPTPTEDIGLVIKYKTCIGMNLTDSNTDSWRFYDDTTLVEVAAEESKEIHH